MQSDARTNSGEPSSLAAIRQWETIPQSVIESHDPDGDFSKKHMLNPTILEMLGDVTNSRVLDAGSGQGYLSRLLARRGAIVTSVEPAESMYAHALRMEQKLQQGITLIRQDLTRADLPTGFDAVVASMVLLSIPNWRDAFGACVAALRPAGRLVFSLEHPLVAAACNNLRNDGQAVVRDYLTERPVARDVATDFHRKLSDYMNAIGEYGLAFERMAEPGLAEAEARSPDAPHGADVFTRIPNFIVISAIKAS